MCDVFRSLHLLAQRKKVKILLIKLEPIIVYQMRHEEQCFNAREFA